MDAASRKVIVDELAASFVGALDVTPADDQPLHVLFPGIRILPPWQPNPTRALARFTNWPDQKPDFWVDLTVQNAAGQPPRNPRDDLVLGQTWRGFSYNFPWPCDPPTPTQAILQWLNRFHENV